MLTETRSRDRVQESGLLLAGQAMEPLTMSMVAVWLGRKVSMQVAEPRLSSNSALRFQRSLTALE